MNIDGGNTLACAGHRRHRGAVNLSAAAPADDQDLVPDLTNFYAQYARSSVAQDREPAAGEGGARVRRPRQARRPLNASCARAADRVPGLMVEFRPLSQAGRAVAANRWIIDATRRPASGSTISKTRSGSTAATPS
jgi:hypothetical protein